MIPTSQDPVTTQELILKGDAARRSFAWAEAEQYYRDALSRAENTLPAPGQPFNRTHLQLAGVLTKLGRLHESRGDIEASEACYRRALTIFSQTTGDEYFDLAIARDHIDVPQTVLAPRAA
ncbi:MAG: tetratricopeptide repeat protein [Bryobacterales bacterium]|nr:tetratricopeptide repeat protein [Bryobacterales bacterium]